MREFSYTITDEIGIHARPAGTIAKKAKEFASTITITKDGKTAELKKLMAVMALGIKQGDTVTVTANGEDEEIAIWAIEKLFQAEL
ncbi:MAG TPA: HPr family phosphocarrier protein [Lachnospiraceae bacterium]|nr:HPr family phosphocarrier protein [Lachnospiraceae bacterium]